MFTTQKLKMLIALMMLLTAPVMAWADGGDGECPMMEIVPERLPDLNIPRYSHCAFYSSQGELTVVGGHTHGFVPTATAEYLKDGEWHVVPMVYCHDDGVCVPLRSGKVLLAGGYEKNLGIGQTFEVEMYDPETHVFNGFGCLDKKRTHVSGVELANGQVVILGNWYNDDAIATWDGGMYFETVKATSAHRSAPYLFPIADDDVLVVSGAHDNYGNPVDAGVVDRLNGDSFRVPMLEEWRPVLLHHQPHAADCLMGNTAKGDYVYLFPVMNDSGQVAIAEVRDTVFSLLPTACPIPMRNEFGGVKWYTQIVTDRERQRAYMLGLSEDETKNYVLVVDYARHPATLMCYYTDHRRGLSGTPPLVMPDGNLVVAGGMDGQSTNFDPSGEVWIFPVVSTESAHAACAVTTFWSRYLLPLAAVGLLILLAFAFVYWRRHRRQLASVLEQKLPSVAVHEPSSADAESIFDEEPNKELAHRLIRLMEDEKVFLSPGLKLTDLAVMLDTNSRYISENIKQSTGLSVSQFVNKYRIEHAQRLMLADPDKKLHAVATESGFTNDKALVRAFRDFTSMTPTEWRTSQH